MRSPFVFGLVCGGLVWSSTALAGFSLNFAQSSLNATQDAVLIRAFNDGIGTGTKISALDLSVSILTGSGGGNKAYFFVDDTDIDGTPDQVQLANAGNNPTGGFIRIGTAPDTFIVASNPTKNVVQPNPWVDGVSAFAVTATTLNPPVANTGTGAIIARLILDKGAGISFGPSTVIGGDVGPAVHPTVDGGDPVPANFGVASNVSLSFSAPAIGTASLSGGGTNPGFDTYALNVDFKNLASSNLSFSFDTNATPDTTIVVGALPAGITATAAGSVISGTVAGNLRGTFDVPLSLNSGGFTGLDTGVLHIVIVPEPASFGLLAGVGLLALRRSKGRSPRGTSGRCHSGPLHRD